MLRHTRKQWQQLYCWCKVNTVQLEIKLILKKGKNARLKIQKMYIRIIIRF